MYIFIEENAFDKAIRKLVAILSQPQDVNTVLFKSQLF